MIIKGSKQAKKVIREAQEAGKMRVNPVEEKAEEKKTRKPRAKKSE